MIFLSRFGGFVHCIPTQTLDLNVSQILCWYKGCLPNLFCIPYNLIYLKSQILSMIHTKALYLKCAEYIACSKINDLNLEIKAPLCFSDPFFIKLYKAALLIYSTVWGCSPCFTREDLDLSSSLSTSLIRMSAGSLLFLDQWPRT